MSGVFVGAPGDVTLPDGFKRWSPLAMSWTGYNGDTWDLSTRASGVLLRSGCRGLGMPSETHYWQEGPAVAGARWNGSITEKRDVFWPVSVFSGDGSRAWLAHDRRLWKTWQPGRVGVWTVAQPGDDNEPGETRQLTLRFKDDGDYAPNTDPSLIGWTQYGLNFVAEQPYWTGEPLQQIFGQGSPVARNFFGGGPVGTPGYGPPYFVTSSSQVELATITNPGDVPAWPVWTVYGPWTSTTVGIGGQVVEVPFALAADEYVQIDTDPTQQTAIFGTYDEDEVTGVITLSPQSDRTKDLGAVDFGSIPDDATVPLATTGVGAGRIGVLIVPRYYRAW